MANNIMFVLQNEKHKINLVSKRDNPQTTKTVAKRRLFLTMSTNKVVMMVVVKTDTDVDI